MILSRALMLPKEPKRSFFLWGPRQTGKTTLLKQLYPKASRIDLLHSEQFTKYLINPGVLREELMASRPEDNLVIIDEIQRCPELLNEVHSLIEDLKIVFILCGSSARKLKRGHANLLGGRALRFELHGLVSAELKGRFNLERMLNHGYLPLNYLEDFPLPAIRAYIADYLKEEIAAEGLVRNLPAFSRFLEIAAISDTQLLEYTNIAQDCGVSAPTIKEYFQILKDTMLGSELPAFVRRPKRKVIKASKFYLADIGVVNVLAKRGRVELGSSNAGLAFENWIYHELRAHSHYSGLEYDLAHWKVSESSEVDFILNGGQIVIEAKATKKVSPHYLKNLYDFKREHRSVKRMIVVSLENQRRKTDEGIEILPVLEFLDELWSGELIGRDT